MRVTVSTNTRAIRGQMRAGTVKGLTLSAEHVLTVSEPRVPLDEGTLKRSGQTDVDAGALRAAISYGSPGAEDYVLVQHEDVTLHHPSGGEAKFLESALLESAGEVGEIIAAQIRRALR